MIRQRGQAIAETAVAVVLLATVLASIPCLIAYQDSQRTALRGARDSSYMAGWAGEASHESLKARLDAAIGELPWRHPLDGSPWLAGQDASTLVHEDVTPPGRAAALMDFIAAPLGESTGAGEGALPLNRAGYHAVSVELRVPGLRGAPEPFSQLALSLTERSAVLTENWNAGSPDQVVERVRRIVPSVGLAQAAAPLRALAAPLRLIEPSFATLCIGRVEPDRLPRTRLGDAAGRGLSEAASRAGSCP